MRPPGLPDESTDIRRQRELRTVRALDARRTESVPLRFTESATARWIARPPIGSLCGVTLGSNSMSTATFNVGPTAFLGSVTGRASIAGGATEAVSLQIVP